MLDELKRLLNETAIYGLSTVVARLLNFLLLPLYTHCLVPADYGIVATLFSYIAFFNVLYAYGMDFSYMRYFKEQGEEGEVFSTAFWSLAATSLLFSAAVTAWAGPLSRAGGVPVPELTRYAAWIMAFDTLSLVPFAYLRMTHRARSYAGVKIANIVLNLALNYLFLVRWKMGVRGVFLASLGASTATLALLAPVVRSQLKAAFDRVLYGSLLGFALPLIPAGLASMAVQVIDRPILLRLTNEATVGLYQANYRLGIFMMMVVNMFDAAWRPFFLQRAAKPGAGEVLGRVLTYFVVGSGALFLAVTFFIGHVVALPLLAGKPLIHPAYWGGLSIVPVVTLGYLFNGVYINFLAPVTIGKRSELVAYATGLGAVVNIVTNFLWIPRWGMMGAALATLAAYMAMAASLYVMGRPVYRVDYEGGRLAHAALALAAVTAAARLLGLGMAADRFVLRLALLAAFPAALAATGFFNEEEWAAVRSRAERWTLALRSRRA